MDLGGLQCLFKLHVRNYRRQAASQECRARTWWTQDEREIEGRPLLFYVPPREVDRYALKRNGEAGIFYGGDHPFPGFPDAGVGQADDGKGRQPRPEVDLDGDRVSVNAVDSGGINA